MNAKHYLVISGIIGGVIGSLLTALLVSPVTAQRDKFDTIQCSKLEVVDAEGRSCVVLSTDVLTSLDDPGVVKIIGSNFGGGSVLLFNTYNSSTDAIPTVHLGNDSNGGFVSVNGTDFYHRTEPPNDMAIPAMAKLSVGPKGGLVKVNNKHALSKIEGSPDKGWHFADKGNKSSAYFGADEGAGFVVTKDKYGQVKTLD